MKTVKTAVLCGLICAITLSMARFNVLCDELRENVFRLHIIANSDDPSDQALKLKVRDAVLEVSGEIFEDCGDSEEAKQKAEENIQMLRETAQQVVNENGFDYNVTVDISPSYFTNREYDTFTLPAGTYDALNIKLGNATGKNWWCVMFPAVCIGASADLSDAVSEKSANIAKNSNDYQIKFKTVEIYEEIKKIISKK